MKKMLFVMNPCAGMKRANRYLPEILGTFNRAGYEVTAYITGGKGDGLRKVTESAAAADIVVCCGGDGTFNETVAGVLTSGALHQYLGGLRLLRHLHNSHQPLLSGGLLRTGKTGERSETYYDNVTKFHVLKWCVKGYFFLRLPI
jgi:hypothetical protein